MPRENLTDVPQSTLEYRVRYAGERALDFTMWVAIAQTWADKEADSGVRTVLVKMTAYHNMMREYYSSMADDCCAELARRAEAANTAADEAAERHEGANLDEYYGNISGC